MLTLLIFYFFADHRELELVCADDIPTGDQCGSCGEGIWVYKDSSWGMVLDINQLIQDINRLILDLEILLAIVEIFSLYC